MGGLILVPIMTSMFLECLPQSRLDCGVQSVFNFDSAANIFKGSLKLPSFIGHQGKAMVCGYPEYSLLVNCILQCE